MMVSNYPVAVVLSNLKYRAQHGPDWALSISRAEMLALCEIAEVAHDLHEWLRTVTKTPELEIKGTDIGAGGTRERLQKLHDALRALSRKPHD